MTTSIKLKLNPNKIRINNYRPDIDGLRAFAILFVIGFHAFPNLITGGFVGVDIFFVISGFLISSIILRKLDNGTFSFLEFYSHRVKRIFPSLIVILISTLLCGWFVLLADEYKQLGHHIAHSSLFISNFTLWKESGYFDNIAETKPLLHLWSLGIEEQYYILWPLLLYLVHMWRGNLLTLTISVLLISFSLNIAILPVDSVGAFYLPITRFWELMIGSMLANISRNKNNIFETNHQLINRHLSILNIRSIKYIALSIRDIKSILGFSLITAAVLFIDKNEKFPGWWALLPTIGTYLIVSAGLKSWLNRTILSNRILVWIGLISYPLYLWHWVLLSFTRIIDTTTPILGVRIFLILFSFMLAWLTYVFVEKPIRFGKSSNKKKIIFLTLTLVGVGCAGYYVYEKDGLSSRLIEFESKLKVVNHVTEITETCKKLVPLNNLTYCLINDPSKPPTVALIGDSHSNRLFSPLSKRYESIGENLLQLGGAGCLPFWGMDAGTIGEPSNCARDMREQLDYILASNSIKTIILAHMGPLHLQGNDLYNKQYRYFIKNLNYPQLVNRNEIFVISLLETLQKFLAAKKKVIMTIDWPELNFDPKACLDLVRPISDPFAVKPSCKLSRSSISERNAEYIKLIKQTTLAIGNIKLINLQDPLCDNSYCYVIKNGQLLYKDSDHLTPYGAELVVNNLWNEFAPKSNCEVGTEKPVVESPTMC